METKTREEAVLTAGELKMMVDAGEPVQVIDVRSPREFEEGHVPGAVNLPMEQVEARLADLRNHEPVVLVCQSGRRAQMCQPILANHPEEVKVLEGGTSAWVDRGFPVVRTVASRLPLMRQVQIAAGSLVLLGTVLGYLVNPGWIFLAMFVGAGLVFAGISGFCGMANVLAVMPWNKSKPGVACEANTASGASSR